MTKLINFIAPLFCERDDAGSLHLSIGRVGFWIAFAPAVRTWFAAGSIGDGHMWIIGFFLSYNLFKKMPEFGAGLFGRAGSSSPSPDREYVRGSE